MQLPGSRGRAHSSMRRLALMEEATQLPKVHVREYVQPLWCGWAEEAGVCGVERRRSRRGRGGGDTVRRVVATAAEPWDGESAKVLESRSIHPQNGFHRRREGESICPEESSDSAGSIRPQL